jgi:hypothetical protein
VQVAFLEIETSQGTIQLEKGGRFSHVAISYKNRWLHTHPYFGVQLVTTRDLEKIGDITNIIELPGHPEPSENFVQQVLGKPYDRFFSWDGEGYYCSKLVAKALGLKPTPMNFEATIWSKHLTKNKGQLGLSPDDIFHELLSRGYLTKRYEKSCSKIFLSP